MPQCSIYLCSFTNFVSLPPSLPFYGKNIKSTHNCVIVLLTGGDHCYFKMHLSSHDLDKVFLNSTCLIVTPTLDPVACVHISPGSMGTGILPVSVRIANLSSFTSVLRGAQYSRKQFNKNQSKEKKSLFLIRWFNFKLKHFAIDDIRSLSNLVKIIQMKISRKTDIFFNINRTLE